MTVPDSLAAALAERYRTERELGAGGMATVYLAEDLRHGRKVAIKVLRPDLAAVIGADRFVREIRTIAALQHPHILGLIDSGEVGGTAYYVMPYVEGESLRDRLRRETQLPIGDAVRIATEVAAALDYAHRNGVIHRDIKPENILLHDGAALVADFGIALAVTTAGGGTRMTETGMSLGTPHYMSPEQAMGEREITARSDVYALGAVLYEMLIGEPPFTGPSAQAIVARVVTEDPRPLAPRRRSIPPHVEAATMTALEKLPADRFGSAAELAAALRDPGYTGATPAGVAHGRAPRGRRAAALAAAALAGLLLGAGAIAATRGGAEPAVARYGLSLPGGIIARAVPSPDGSAVVLEPIDTASALWVKYRDQYDPVELPGTRGATQAVWAPDGSGVAFRSGPQVRRVALTGGPAVTVDDSAGVGLGLAWLDDGTIVSIPRGAEVRRIAADGGPATMVFADTALMAWPQAIPGRSAILFTQCHDDVCSDGGEIHGLDLESGRSSTLITGAVRAWAGPAGSLVYVRRDGSVHAVPFDARRLEARGAPVPLFDRVMVVNGSFPLMEVSSSGTVVFRRGESLEYRDPHELVWVDRRGTVTPVDSGWTFHLTEIGENYGWSLSPDGRRLAVGMNTALGDDIWVKQLPDGPLSRITFDSAAEYRPTWTPDGRVMYGSDRVRSASNSLATALYVRRADGTGGESLVLQSPSGVYEGRWSPDGRWLLFRTGGQVDAVGGRDIFGIRPGVDSTPVPLVATGFDERAAALSPDGRWLAYESTEAGRAEIFLRPFPDTEAGKWQISNGGGVAPLWSRSGDELFYVNADRDMVAAPLAFDGAEPRIGARTVLFRIPPDMYMSPSEFYTPWDVAADGRFLMARRLAPPEDVVAASPVIVVENWFAEVERMLEQ